MQCGDTALHYAAGSGDITLVKYLVEKCQAVITQIRSGANFGITDYLKTQLMKMVMGIDRTILPFYAGVRGIIIKYMQ